MKIKNGKHWLYIHDPGARHNDGWFCYETTMQGLIPAIWTATLPKKKHVKKWGIDISEHNGNIDLTKYKDHFVIIRGGYWNKVDRKAKRNMDICEKLGIPYGVYWYSYALTTKQAEMEAKKCLEVIKGRKIKAGVWFDMEDADGYKKRHGFPSSKTITAMCNKFCGIIKKNGYYPGIYASQSWFGSKITTKKYDRWVANWGKDTGKKTTDTSKLGTMQQYTSKPLDKDCIFVELSHYQTKKAKKAAKKKAKAEAKKPKPKKTNTQIAKEVINGKWGNGEERKKKLKAAGYNYQEVQKIVNKLI